MQKRGQGEQFNWVFVLIAGAIVLAFFTVFTFQYIQLQEKRQNLRVAQTLGENIRLLESTEQALDADAFPLGGGFQFRYECAADHSFLTINNDYTQDVSDHLLFMPKLISTTAFRAWIAAWQYPYYITHILYFEHPDTHHYFIVDPVGQSFVTNLHLPRIFTATTFQRPSSLPADQTIHARVTFFTQTPPTAPELAAITQTIPHATIIHIQPIKDEVTFYDQNNDPVFHQSVAGKELLLGALFSDDPDQYGCLINRSLSAFDRTTRIYSEKAKLLPHLSQNPDCTYQTIHHSLLNYRQQPLHSSSSLRQSLEDQNRDLSGKGCQVVF